MKESVSGNLVFQRCRVSEEIKKVTLLIAKSIPGLNGGAFENGFLKAVLENESK